MTCRLYLCAIDCHEVYVVAETPSGAEMLALACLRKRLSVSANFVESINVLAVEGGTTIAPLMVENTGKLANIDNEGPAR